jgi:V8-like Glu-specific endopeptidase
MMATQEKSVKNCTIEELKAELMARGVYQALAENHLKLIENKMFPGSDEFIARMKKICDSPKGNSDQSLRHIKDIDLITEAETFALEILLTFGIDNRLDWYEIKSKSIQQNTSCVAGICFRGDLIDNGEGWFRLNVESYASKFKVAPSERFSHQPVVSGYFATGVLVGNNLIATAGHVAKKSKEKELAFVFGYRMLSSYSPVLKIPKDAVYYADNIIYGDDDQRNEGSDWALVKLESDVIGQEIARLSAHSSDITLKHPVYVIGYPNRLPLKYAGGAKVCRNADKHYFGANLDTYAYNSGSPVFNGETHEVEGIAFENPDESDLVFNRIKQGSVSRVLCDNCSQGYVKCIRVSKFIDILDKL